MSSPKVFYSFFKITSILNSRISNFIKHNLAATTSNLFGKKLLPDNQTLFRPFENPDARNRTFVSSNTNIYARKNPLLDVGTLFKFTSNLNARSNLVRTVVFEIPTIRNTWIFKRCFTGTAAYTNYIGNELLLNRKLFCKAAPHVLNNNRVRFVSMKDTCKDLTKPESKPKEKICQDQKPLFDPYCKVAAVFGGTGGVGYATAFQLLCRGVKRLAILGQNTQKGLEAVQCLNAAHGKDKVMFIKCDVRDRTAVASGLKLLKCEYDHIDVFVNCAGIWSENPWSEELNINLFGTINVNLEIAKIAAKSQAIVVNVTGNLGLETFPPSPIFAASNAAVMEFSRSFGHKMNVGTYGLRIITVCLGVTKTDSLKSVEKRMLTPQMGRDLNAILKVLPVQNVDACAQGILDVIINAENGSIWVIENSKLFSAKIPSWRGSSRVVSHYI